MIKRVLKQAGLALIIASGIFHADAQTTLWGVTSGGGPNSGGVIFQMDPATGAYVVRHSFTSGGLTNAYLPNAPQGTPVSYNGKLWGTTSIGGDSTGGTIYSFDPATNTFTTHFSFSNTRGSAPRGEMIVYNSKLWGVTTNGGGGIYSYGVIYSYDPASGIYTKEHQFTDAIPSEGNGLVVYNNKLYGMAAFGGTGSGGGGGTLYSYDAATSTYTVLHNFNFNDPNGYTGYGTPVVYNNKLYAQMSFGGANAYGTIFSYDPANGNVTVLHDNATATGGLGYGNLLVNGSTMYGLLSRMANNDAGSLYSIDPVTGSFTALYKFDTAVAYGGLGTPILYNNKLYAMNGNSPSHWGGIFSYDLTSGAYSLLHSFDLATGVGPRNGNHLIPLNVPMPTAVQGIAPQQNAVLLWPNPTDAQLHITSQNTSAAVISLLDITGRVVLSSALQSGTSSVDMHLLSQGIYAYRILNSQGTLLQQGRVVKQ